MTEYSWKQAEGDRGREMSQFSDWRYVADDEVVFHEDLVLGRRYRMVVSSGRVERQWFGEWVPSDADPLVMFAGQVRIA